MLFFKGILPLDGQRYWKVEKEKWKFLSRHEPIIWESGRSCCRGVTNESGRRKINKTSGLDRNAPRRHQPDSAGSSCECFSKTGSKARMIVSLHCFCVWLDSERVVFQEGNFARFNRIWARLIHFAYLPEPVQPYWKVGARLYLRTGQFCHVSRHFTRFSLRHFR